MKVNKFQPLRQAATPEQMDQKLKDVASMYEKQFLREMMKSMRATVSEGDVIKKNQAEKIFSQQLDEQYVDKWGAQGGIGLSDLIYNQLKEKYGAAMGLKAYPGKAVLGPQKLSEKDQLPSNVVPVASPTAKETESQE